jgi:hypothetical protein
VSGINIDEIQERFACYAIRSMKPDSNFATLKMIYHASFHSLMSYGIVFWGNSSEAKKIFL